jgi:hypothetical protein
MNADSRGGIGGGRGFGIARPITAGQLGEFVAAGTADGIVQESAMVATGAATEGPPAHHADRVATRLAARLLSSRSAALGGPLARQSPQYVAKNHY